MGCKRFLTSVALIGLVAGQALAQTAPAPTGAPVPAGAINPAAAQTPAPPAQEPEFALSDGVIATVNDQVITGYDLRQRMLTVISMSGVTPTQQNLPAIQQQALQALVDERLEAAEIAKYPDLKVSDEEIDQELTAMAQEAGLNLDGYLAALRQIGIEPRFLREQLKVEIGWRELVGGRFNSRSRVSRAQVEQALRQQNENASKPQYLVGEIYLDASRVGGQQAAMDGARQLVAQMIQGAPFQAVARQFSAAPSAARGGDAGWLVSGTLQPQLQAALDALDVGELSQPIPVDGGVYIVYMRDKRAGAATSLVTLKQVMVQADASATEAQIATATARLEALRPQLTCDNMLQRATSEQGLLGADLGESDVANLAPQFQQVARTSEIGSISAPIRTPLGVHLVAVCGRRVGGAEAQTFEQVESRLRGQQLAMLGRRYIRDLRNDALIEMK